MLVRATYVGKSNFDMPLAKASLLSMILCPSCVGLMLCTLLLMLSVTAAGRSFISFSTNCKSMALE